MGRITGTLTLGDSNALCTLKVPIIVYLLYAVGTAEPFGSRLPGKFCYIMVVAPDLLRAFFYAETRLMLHSTIIKLIPLSKLIINGYPSH